VLVTVSVENGAPEPTRSYVLHSNQIEARKPIDKVIVGEKVSLVVESYGMRKNRRSRIGGHNELSVPSPYSRLISCSNPHNDSLNCLDCYLYCQQSSEIYRIVYTCSTVGLRYRFGLLDRVFSPIVEFPQCNWVHTRGHRQGCIAIVSLILDSTEKLPDSHSDIRTALLFFSFAPEPISIKRLKQPLKSTVMVDARIRTVQIKCHELSVQLALRGDRYPS
jgi:hypothetical protein